MSQCEGSLNPPSGELEYRLQGPQVEPTAGFWLTGHTICVPRREDVLEYSEGGKAEDRWRVTSDHFPNETQLDLQLGILKQLIPARNDIPPYPAGRTFTAGTESLTITPLSRFINLQPPPFGTIFDVEIHKTVGIKEGEVNNQRARILADYHYIDQGQELARAFENETPGLFHRHALNWLLFNRLDISPPRQARIWFALDLTISTALNAAWHYKWAHPTYSRLLRPAEYAKRCKDENLNVLFDKVVDDNGREINTTLREGEMPGTPRHPAWPSGHSTYSAAASHILEYFFSPGTLRNDSDTSIFQQAKALEDAATTESAKQAVLDNPIWIAAELRKLANNIGEARLWAGVHWTSDHVAGQRIGRAAAQAVVAQFLDDCIPRFQSPAPTDRPSRDELNQTVGPNSRICPKEPKDPNERRHDEITPQPERGADFLRTLSPT